MAYGGYAMDHVMKIPRPSPSISAYYNQSKTGGIEGLGMRLQFDLSVVEF